MAQLSARRALEYAISPAIRRLFGVVLLALYGGLVALLDTIIVDAMIEAS